MAPRVVVLGSGLDGEERRHLEEAARRLAAAYGAGDKVVVAVAREGEGVKGVRTADGWVLLQVPAATPQAVLQAMEQAALGEAVRDSSGAALPAAVVDGSSLARSWAREGGPARLGAIRAAMTALEGLELEREQVMVVVDEGLREEVDDLPGLLALEGGGGMLVLPTPEEAWQAALEAAERGARLVTGRDLAREMARYPWLAQPGRALALRLEGGEPLLVPAVPPQAEVGPPAGLGRRIVAYLVDALAIAALVLVAQIVIGSIVLAALGPAEGEALDRRADVVLAALQPAAVIAAILYRAAFEGGEWQATPGKRLLGLRVARVDGGAVNFWQAVLRQLGRLPCELTLGMGYLIALWTRRKQGLHDLIAGTVVVRRRSS